MSKLIQIVKRQLEWQKLPEQDQQIIRAEQDMVEAYIRWQRLLAARDAERDARQDVAVMIRDVYQQHQFEV
jgi:hypothetical protein